LPAVIDLTGLGRTKIRALIKTKQFPPAIRLTDSTAPNAPVGWLQSAVEDWIARRVSAHKLGEIEREASGGRRG
jgi:prophage regulatory protein